MVKQIVVWVFLLSSGTPYFVYGNDTFIGDNSSKEQDDKPEEKDNDVPVHFSEYQFKKLFYEMADQLVQEKLLRELNVLPYKSERIFFRFVITLFYYKLLLKDLPLVQKLNGMQQDDFFELLERVLKASPSLSGESLIGVKHIITIDSLDDLLSRLIKSKHQYGTIMQTDIYLFMVSLMQMDALFAQYAVDQEAVEKNNQSLFSIMQDVIDDKLLSPNSFRRCPCSWSSCSTQQLYDHTIHGMNCILSFIMSLPDMITPQELKRILFWYPEDPVLTVEEKVQSCLLK